MKMSEKFETRYDLTCVTRRMNSGISDMSERSSLARDPRVSAVLIREARIAVARES